MGITGQLLSRLLNAGCITILRFLAGVNFLWARKSDVKTKQAQIFSYLPTNPPRTTSSASLAAVHPALSYFFTAKFNIIFSSEPTPLTHKFYDSFVSSSYLSLACYTFCQTFHFSDNILWKVPTLKPFITKLSPFCPHIHSYIVKQTHLRYKPGWSLSDSEPQPSKRQCNNLIE